MLKIDNKSEPELIILPQFKMEIPQDFFLLFKEAFSLYLNQ